MGTGPRLQIVDTYPDVARELEKKFHQWLRDIRFARKLRDFQLAKRASSPAGRAFRELPLKVAYGKFSRNLKSHL